jgi:hypothetical protein
MSAPPSIQPGQQLMAAKRSRVRMIFATSVARVRMTHVRGGQRSLIQVFFRTPVARARSKSVCSAKRSRVRMVFPTPARCLLSVPAPAILASSWRSLLALACLSLMAATSAARADDGVKLDLTDCAGARAQDIAQLVRLEPSARAADLSAELRCSEERASITVRDPRRRAPLQLSLPLAGTQREARARLLALAIAELLATSRLEIEPRASPPPPPAAEAEPRASSPPPPAAEAEPRPYSLWLGAGVTRAFAPALFAPTLQLAAARRFGPLTWLADLDLDWAATARSDANITARALSLAAGAGVSLRAAPWTWEVALAARGGVVWLRGEPRSADMSGLTLSAAWLAPEFQSALALALSPQLRLRLACQLGYVVTPVRGLDADGGSLLELRGVRVALVLGVGLAL